MQFPNDYDTRMFPNSRYLAMARAFAIWAALLFLLIAALGGVLVWTMHAKRVEPVLISVSDNGATWTAVLGARHPSPRLRAAGGTLEYSAYRVMQEAVVGNFARMWFSISGDADENETNWCRCDRISCGADASVPRCAVCCMAGESLFERFLEVVAGDFRGRAASGEEWSVAQDSIRAAPIGAASDKGGLWRLTATVRKNNGGAQKIEAFARVARAADGYPATLGYFVTEFAAYPAE